jgi:beta-aspartyl-peptidase (threonine type)
MVMVEILKKAHEQLKGGASAQDVVQSAVETMEDSGHFNAGKGGTRTSKGTVELDASIMDGKTLAAGAVGSVKDVKNPIRLARMVKDKTKHVFMVGEGASAKAKEFGLDMVSTDYFVSSAPMMMTKEKFHYGTVGAVALDRCGDLAAATSTGGLFGKAPGRLGDSPVIGAGTYANNKTVAVSCTGEGEKFIRASAGVRISSILQYTDRSLKSAVEETLSLVKELGGDGGIITVSKTGQVVTSTNDNMPMPRGFVRENGVVIQND